MSGESFEVKPIGAVESSLKELEEAPKQGDEGAPDAWLRFEPRVGAGLEGLRPGDEVVLLTWLDRASREVLRCLSARRHLARRAGRLRHAFS